MKAILIRHGEPDYVPCDKRGFKGQGRDLAPLTEMGIQQAEQVSHNKLLTGSSLIVSSPYTRAMQTAAIISKNTGLNIVVEIDLHEIILDKLFQNQGKEDARALHSEFMNCKGQYPENEMRSWETIEEVIQRILPVFERYQAYKKIIVVTHGGVIRRFVKEGKIGYCNPYEIEFNKGDACYSWID